MDLYTVTEEAFPTHAKITLTVAEGLGWGGLQRSWTRVIVNSDGLSEYTTALKELVDEFTAWMARELGI